MSLICWWTVISCTPGLSPVLYQPRKSMSENTFLISYEYFQRHCFYPQSPKIADYHSYSTKLPATVPSHSHLAFNIFIKSWWLSKHDNGALRGISNFEVSILRLMWLDNWCHSGSCSPPVVKLLNFLAEALVWLQHMYNCTAAVSRTATSEKKMPFWLSTPLYSYHLLQNVHHHLLKLLLFRVVVVSVNDDHTVDHIVVKFKAVAQFNVASSLLNGNSISLKFYHFLFSLMTDVDLSSNKGAINGHRPTLLSLYPGPVLGYIHDHLEARTAYRHNHPSAISFLWIHTILHDILGFDTIITRYQRYFMTLDRCKICQKIVRNAWYAWVTHTMVHVECIKCIKVA